MYACRHCGKEFGYKQSRSRHELRRCEKRPEIAENPPKLDLVPITSNSHELDVSLSKETSLLTDNKLVNDVNIQINYVLPKQNYWEMLKEKKGTPGALQFLHRCADLKLGGDILLFEELFLPQDNKASWPIARKEGSSKEIILKEPDGTIIDDCASRIVYDRFVGNYKDALLLGSNQILSILIEPEKVEREIEKEKQEIKAKIKDIHPDDLEGAYISIFTEYDFGLFQERAYTVEHEHPKPHNKFALGMLDSNF